LSAADVNKALDIPDGPRAIAFRAVERVLREDPSLDRVVKTWLSREGQKWDMEAPAPDMLPLVALSPMPRPDTNLTNVSAKVNFAMSVEVWVPGSCVDDATNLWDLVCEALVLGKPFRETTVFEYLRCQLPDIKIPDLWVVDPAFVGYLPSRKEGDPAMQRGLGSIALFFQRPR
jgi:hypothetical protein